MLPCIDFRVAAGARQGCGRDLGLENFDGWLAAKSETEYARIRLGESVTL
jgi:hypothetical protein